MMQKDGYIDGYFGKYPKISNYIDINKFNSSETWKFKHDNDSLNYSQLSLYYNYTGTNYSIFRVSRNDYIGFTSVNFYVRAKNFNDGIDVSTKSLEPWFWASSMGHSKRQFISEDWKWYKFNLTLEEWTNSNMGMLGNNGSMLIDGVIIEPILEIENTSI